MTSYAGFDRADCPPLDMMARLKRETNLEWVGLYLPAPSQPGSTWKGKRAPLVAQGWGIAPIYVGQQITGPGSHKVTASQGAFDGGDAAQAMRNEGFAPGSWVYLDLENGTPFTAAQKAYVGAWVDAVNDEGFRAGVYCSYTFASEVKALRPSVRLWVFHVPTTKQHAVAGKRFLTPDPKTSGYAGASIWQRDDSALLSAFGNLLVDLDCAAMRDPGAPEMVAGGQVAPATPVAAPPPTSPPAPAPAPSPPVTAPGSWFTRLLAYLFPSRAA